jgi:hypothetical protein
LAGVTIHDLATEVLGKFYSNCGFTGPGRTAYGYCFDMRSHLMNNIIAGTLYYLFMGKQKFGNFTILISLYSIALTVAQIFGLIFFYRLFNDEYIPVIAGIAAQYFIYSICTGLLAKQIGRSGTRVSIAFSFLIFTAASLVLAVLDPRNFLPYFLLWNLLMGVGKCLFYISFHYYYYSYSNQRLRGKKMGIFNLATLVLTVAAPYIASLASAWQGLTGLGLVSALIFALGILVAARLEDHRFNFTLNLFNFPRFNSLDKTIKMTIFNESGVTDFYYKIYSFLLVNMSIPLFGLAQVIINLVSGLILYVLDRSMDYTNVKRSLKLQSVIYGFCLACRALAFDLASLMLFDIFYSIISRMKGSTYDMVCYEIIEKKNQEILVDEKLIVREFYHVLFIAFSFTFSIPVFFFGGVAGVMIYGALISFLMILI